jgi:hypothetical protein
MSFFFQIQRFFARWQSSAARLPPVLQKKTLRRITKNRISLSVHSESCRRALFSDRGNFVKNSRWLIVPPAVENGDPLAVRRLSENAGVATTPGNPAA